MQDQFDFRSILQYDALTGDIKVIKSGRKLFADEEGYVKVYVRASAQKVRRIKLDKLALVLSGVKIRSNQAILHKNLDITDNRLSNLVVVSKSVYKQVQEALLNLDHGIRIDPHPADQWSYVLSWKENGSLRKRVVSDIISAKKAALRLRLRASKLITKYCTVDE